MKTSSQFAGPLAEVRRDISRLEERLAELRVVEAYLSSKSGADNSRSSDTGPIGTSRFVEGVTQSDAAEVVLRRAGRAMNATEIARWMIEDGFPATDVKKLKPSLYAALHREPDRFLNVGKGQFRLKAQAEQQEKQEM